MYKGLAFASGLLAFCGFITCFGAFHMLNKIVHINGNDILAMHEENVKLSSDYSDCHNAYILDDLDNLHLTRLELFYMKWSVVLSILYSFAVMILIRVKYLSNFDINFITSNTMMLVGALLTMVLVIATCRLNELTLFIEDWCNDVLVYNMFFIALNTSVAVVFFLIPSCQYYFELAKNQAF
ncbi:uncharacterized protein Dwil_GK24930 [Drosophila willistoni]|uniref:Uncharacterized protein n=1 Tax=Drosophila willistoni TaxID=7260 RepID=B4NDE3_DROWI|nr:uncharacterized protein LOC6648685 [Drosophila willistoni]EDW82849.1 uncharacterized protein Dwil_GK24930 [Drosophila willistoni]